MKKLISLLLVFILVIGILPVVAYADGSGSKDFSDGFELLFDGEPWKVFAVEDIEDSLTADDLHITVTDKNGSEVPSDAYTLVIGYETGWDNKNDMPFINPCDGPYKITDGEDRESGFLSCGAYAVAKDGSGYTGKTRTNEFMIWHKYSFNWFGGAISFGDEFKTNSQWFWHDYYEIPEGSLETPAVYDISGALVDPSLYTLTWYERGTDIPDPADPDYENKLYPRDNPLRGMPETPGSYFACAEAEDPYYGTAWVDFNIYATSIDLSDGCEMRFDGKEWGDYYLDGKNDSLSVGDLDITLVKGGKEIVPEDAYELHFFIEKGWDDKTDSPIHEVVEEPFGLSALPEAMDRGWLMHSVYAVAKDGSGYTGQTPEFEFMIKDKYTLDRNSGMIDFGEEYLSRSFRSWHCFYEIPASKMHEPVVTDLLGNELDADNYTLTYFERNDAALNGDNPDRDMLYCEDKPLNGMPAEAGQYFVRLDGKGDYYGVNYADFDIVNSYAQPYGSTARYYDGYTLYMDKDETIKLRFELEPAGSEVMIPGWFSDDLNDAGFRLAFEPETIDGISYAVIDTNGMTEPAEGTLTFNWYKLSEVFDEHGVHWDTAPRYYTTVINIVMQPDVEILGDADGNGEVEVIDATIIQRYIMSFFVPYDTNVIMRGDVDGDDLLTIVDATLIQRYSTDIKTACRIGSAISEKKA